MTNDDDRSPGSKRDARRSPEGAQPEGAGSTAPEPLTTAPGSAVAASSFGTAALHEEVLRLRDRLDRLEALVARGAADRTPTIAPSSAALQTSASQTSAPRGAAPQTLFAPPPPPPPPPRLSPARELASASMPADPSVHDESPIVQHSQIATLPVEAGRTPEVPPAETGPSAKGPSLELFLGRRVAPAAGALIVLLCVVLFFRYAYTQGWLGSLSPLWRCILAAGFGGVLLAGGEWCLRRVNRLAAVGLFAAGLGTLYLTVLVAFRQFHLVGNTGAFVLLALTALAGVAITIRARLLAVGIVSLVAGYAAPLLTAGRGGQDLALAIYLTMLLGIVLGLARLVPQPFRHLRSAMLPVHGLLGLLWLVASDVPVPLGTVVALGWWALVFGESLLAALAGQSRRTNAVILVGASGWLAVALPLGMRGTLVDTHLAGALLAVVAVAAVALVSTFRGPAQSGVEEGTGAFVRVLRQHPSSAIGLFSVATWLQSGVLLATAAAIQLSAGASTVAWLALGLAAIELGRRIRGVLPTSFGVAVLLAAVLKLAVFDSWRTALERVLLEVTGLGIEVTGWTLLCLGAAVAIGVASRRMVAADPKRDWWAGAPGLSLRWVPVNLRGLSLILWLMALEALASGALVSLLWLGVACAVLATRRFRPDLRPLELGGVVLLAALTRWLAGDAWESAGGRVASSTAGTLWSGLGGNGWLTLNLLLTVPMAGAAIWFDRILRRERPEVEASTSAPGGFLRVAISVAPVLGVLLSVSAAIWRGVQGAAGFDSVFTHRLLWWTILWSLGGLLLVRLGALRRQPAGMRVGAFILAIAALAWLIVGSLYGRIQSGVAEVAVMLNVQFLAGMVCVAALCIGGWLTARRGATLRQETGMLLTLAALVLLCAGSFEIERLVPPEAVARADYPFVGAAVSIWWALLAFGAVVAGFMVRVPVLRHAGLGLMALTAAKFLVLDLHGVENIWRIVASLIVGLLLIVVSVLYGKFGRRVEEGAPPALVDDSGVDRLG